MTHNCPTPGGARYVYLIVRDEYVKVGVTVDPQQRLRQIIRGQHGAEHPPSLAGRGAAYIAAAFTGDTLTEHVLHLLLAPHRVVGEWYTLDGLRPIIDHVMEHLDSLPSGTIYPPRRHTPDPPEPGDIDPRTL